jgi:hypothetical protein
MAPDVQPIIQASRLNFHEKKKWGVHAQNEWLEEEA